MVKYLLLKHYRGAPAAVNDALMDQWTPEEISAHMQCMQDFADRLTETGEYVDGQALSPDGTFVRYDRALGLAGNSPRLRVRPARRSTSGSRSGPTSPRR